MLLYSFHCSLENSTHANCSGNNPLTLVATNVCIWNSKLMKKKKTLPFFLYFILFFVFVQQMEKITAQGHQINLQIL